MQDEIFKISVGEVCAVSKSFFTPHSHSYKVNVCDESAHDDKQADEPAE